MGTADSPDAVPASAPSWTRLALVAGSVALAVGAWLLLDNAGLAVPDLGRHWPAFVILGGLASLVDFFLVSRRPAACGLGTFGVTLGFVFYLLTLDWLGWTQVRRWGPGLLLAAGIGLLASWLAGGMRRTRQLAAGLASCALAGLAWGWYLIRLELLWGAILVAVGALLVGRVIVARRARR